MHGEPALGGAHTFATRSGRLHANADGVEEVGAGVELELDLLKQPGSLHPSKPASAIAYVRVDMNYLLLKRMPFRDKPIGRHGDFSRGHLRRRGRISMAGVAGDVFASFIVLRTRSSPSAAARAW